MTNPGNASPFASAAEAGDDSGVLVANRLASEIRRRWCNGEDPDIAAVLAEHPELKRYKSVVLDLAHDEYRLRLEMGESLSADEFSRRFPTLQKSLYLLIEVHRLLNRDPHFRMLQEDSFWPKPGESLLGFSLIVELGRGTFARVFLASEPALGNRLVALKVALQGAEEAEMLGKLQHPNIVPVYSVQEDAATGLTAVCMPYLGRATLGDVLDRAFAANASPVTNAQVIVDAIRALSDDDTVPPDASFDRILRKGTYVDGVIHLAVQLADALAYTHSRGICHRDLKPSNVLMSVDGRPLLLDFNLSLDEQVNASRIGGTLPYMAPEHLESVVLEKSERRGHADPRSDLFSLGVILRELLCGSLPFGPIPWDRPVEQIAEHLLQLQQKGPRPIRAENTHVDKRLAQVIDDCLAFDPEHRPETASALAAAFRKQLTPVRRGKRWVGNHRRRVSLLGFLLVVLFLAGGSFLALRDPYSVRQFNRGLDHYQRGEYKLAVDCLGESIRSNPENAEAFIARGRAHLKLKNFNWAFDDFHAAFQLAPSPKISAYKGYCLSKGKRHKEAIDSYRNALDEGYRSPAVLNNMGFGYIQLRRLDDAEECLRHAVELDQDMHAAHHNLVVVFVNRAVNGQSIPKSAVAHARKAVETGPPSAELYYHVALLYALGAKQDAGPMRPAVEHLKKAVAEGLDPSALESIPAFSSLREQRDFQKLLTAPTPSEPAAQAEHLVEPL